MKAIAIKPLPNYKPDVTFQDGVTGEIDLKELVQKGIFEVLQDDAVFSQVKFNQSAVF